MVDLAVFSHGDVYIDDPYQDMMFRYDHAARKYYARDYGRAEHEIRHTNSLFREALSGGKLITREEYFRDVDADEVLRRIRAGRSCHSGGDSDYSVWSYRDGQFQEYWFDQGRSGTNTRTEEDMRRQIALAPSIFRRFLREP